MVNDGTKRRRSDEVEDSTTIGEMLSKQKEEKNKKARTIVEKVLEKLQKDHPTMGKDQEENAESDNQTNHQDTTNRGDKDIQEAEKQNTNKDGKRVKHVASKTNLNERRRKEMMKIKKELNAVAATYKPTKLKPLTKLKIVVPQSKKQPSPKQKKIDALEENRKRPRIKERETERQPKMHKPASYQLQGSTSKSSIATTTITATEKKKEKRIIQKRSEANEIEDDPLTENAQPRAGPLKFMNFVGQLTEQKRQAVREIGFGALLSIDFPSSKRMFNKSLLESFDPDSSSLLLPLGNIIEIKQDDVEIVFGLPRGKIEIEEPTFHQYSPEFRQFLTAWRQSWGLDPIRGSPKTANIIERYTTELKDGPADEQFILHFVICAVNCLMVSTASNDCNFKFLNSIMDITKVKSVNWCKFVHQQLIKTTKHFKKTKPKFYTGPLCFLTLCYFDRIQRQGIEQPRGIPLVSTWTKEMIQKRLTMEVEDGFGRGKLLDRIAAKTEDKETGVHKNASTSTEYEIEVFLVKFFNLLKIIGPHVKELGSMLVKAEMLFPDSSLLNKTSEFIGKMMKQGRKEPRSILSQEEEIYGSDSFLEEVSRLEKSLMDELKNKKRDSISKKADFDPFKMFNLGIESSQNPRSTQQTTQNCSRSHDATDTHWTEPTELPQNTPKPESPDQTTVNLTLQLRTPTLQGLLKEPTKNNKTTTNSVTCVQGQSPTTKLADTEDVLKMFESQGEEDSNEEPAKKNENENPVQG